VVQEQSLHVYNVHNIVKKHFSISIRAKPGRLVNNNLKTICVSIVSSPDVNKKIHKLKHLYRTFCELKKKSINSQ
jgi:hypothetical protein